MISKELLQEAKEKIGISAADIMADVLSLEQYDAKNKKALCCWHSEKTPSLIFDQKRLRFHCFSCGKSVDILDSFIVLERGGEIDGVPARSPNDRVVINQLCRAWVQPAVAGGGGVHQIDFDSTVWRANR